MAAAPSRPWQSRALLVWSLAMAGCGGTQSAEARTAATPAPPAEAPAFAKGAEEAQAAVGPMGGVLALESGVRLEIPAGALRERGTLTLRLGAASKTFEHRKEDRPLSPIVHIEPARELAPGETLLLSVPYNGVPSGFSRSDLAIAIETVDDEQRVMYGTGVRTRWDFAPVDITRDRLVAKLDELQGLRLRFLATQ